jgi:hypothetical protein
MAWYDVFLGGRDDRQLERIEGKLDALIAMAMMLSERTEVQMSAAQQKLDELKGVMSDLVAKVTAVFDGMQEAKDDPAELQALIDQGKAVTAAADAILNPAPPTP